MDDIELFDLQQPFPLTELVRISGFVNELVFLLMWHRVIGELSRASGWTDVIDGVFPDASFQSTSRCDDSKQLSRLLSRSFAGLLSVPTRRASTVRSRRSLGHPVSLVMSSRV